ncbi:MAG: malic enzyme-like NAD(P)-binding protein [Nevskiales bacterium]
MSEPDLRQQALDYHAKPRPGKLCIGVTKPFTTQDELSLAYSPGVAEPVEAIAKNPEDAYRYTSKGNLVAVITDGSAILGLGNLGALASKPVMEGKAVLFKKFADIDVFDIEVATQDADQFIQTVVNIAPTFGGINLEDIGAPHCFKIERELVEKLDIPVFHDDQHGTAIVLAAALLNALELQGKKIFDVKIVCVGAGAAGIACMTLLVALGAKKDNIYLLDRKGVIHSERDDLSQAGCEQKRQFALRTGTRTLAQAMLGADVFIGLSGPDLVSQEMVKSMAPRPIVLPMSNPDPEISPEQVKAVRADAIIGTGRSDYPNQVNNVLGFPYIFRGALDVRARRISQAMHLAAVYALKDLAKLPVPQSVLEAYEVAAMSFGPEYIIPKPFDPRLIDRIPPAVAQAAIESGVARTDYPKHYPRLDIKAA